MARDDPPPARDEQIALARRVSAKTWEQVRRGAALFDAGEYWAAHEVWEEIWRAESRPIRSFYQGLIQMAAGYHHWTVTHRPAGVQILLARAVDHLRPYAPAYLGADVASLVTDALQMRDEAQTRDAAWLAAYPANAMPRFRWAP